MVKILKITQVIEEEVVQLVKFLLWVATRIVAIPWLLLLFGLSKFLYLIEITLKKYYKVKNNFFKK